MACNSIRSTLSNKAITKLFVTAIFAYGMTLRKVAQMNRIIGDPLSNLVHHYYITISVIICVLT